MQWRNRSPALRSAASQTVIRRSLVAFLFFWASAARSYSQDTQSWNELDLATHYGRVDVLIPLVARFETTQATPQLSAVGVMADLPLASHLTITAGYLLVVLEPQSTIVHVPLIAFTGSMIWRRMRLGDRNRFETLFDHGNSPTRYRNRLSADLLLAASGRWHIFADDEIFFKVNDLSWNQNRFRAGIGKAMGRRLWLDGFYLQKNPSGASPIHVVGATLRVAINGGSNVLKGATDHGRN